MEDVSVIKKAAEMNAEHLLTHFDRIADAPDAIPRLRRFVLDLAVRGKLVPQDPSDEPASIPLMEGKYGKLQKMSPADISGWFVASVGLLLEFQYGKGMKASERLNEGPVPVFGSNGIVGYCETPLTETPSIIVGRKGSAGALNRCDGPSWTTDVAYFVEAPNYFDLQYLLVGLQTLDLESLGKGVKPGLSRSDVYELPLSIPPLAEQHRIVAKVDELMALCDRLEAARMEREATRDRMTTASLAHLNAPDPDPATFQNHAAFALNNLTPLTTRPDQIKALRQTILNLAVRGKLVPQNPNDEPASELLKRIREWQIEAIAKKQIRAPRKSLKLIRHDESPYLRPNGWEWARLGEVIYIQSGDGLTAANMRGGDIPVFGGNGINGYHDTRNVDQPTIVIGRVGYYCGSIHVTPPKAWVTDNAFITNFCQDAINLRFLVLLLNGTNLKEDENATAQPVISGSKIYPIIVGLPPLAEQHRIVAKVDEMMALCDRLEASLTTGDETHGRLVEALLCEAIEPDGNRYTLAC